MQAPPCPNNERCVSFAMTDDEISPVSDYDPASASSRGSSVVTVNREARRDVEERRLASRKAAMEIKECWGCEKDCGSVGWNCSQCHPLQKRGGRKKRRKKRKSRKRNVRAVGGNKKNKAATTIQAAFRQWLAAADREAEEGPGYQKIWDYVRNNRQLRIHAAQDPSVLDDAARIDAAAPAPRVPTLEELSRRLASVQQPITTEELRRRLALVQQPIPTARFVNVNELPVAPAAVPPLDGGGRGGRRKTRRKKRRKKRKSRKKRRKKRRKTRRKKRRKTRRRR